jgi:hypothetical protein
VRRYATVLLNLLAPPSGTAGSVVLTNAHCTDSGSCGNNRSTTKSRACHLNVMMGGSSAAFCWFFTGTSMKTSGESVREVKER